MLSARYDMRLLLTAIGSTLCIVAVLLAPLAASPPKFRLDELRIRSRSDLVPNLSFNSDSALKSVSIDRDPFIEPPGIAARIKQESAAHSIGAGIVVEGIIEGTRPRALVRIGTTEQVVAVGDILDGDTVIRIASDGVRFSSGLTVPPAQRSPE